MAAKLKFTIFHLPKQTADVSTIVNIPDNGPTSGQGQANINIPGIGTGSLSALEHSSPSSLVFSVSIKNL